MKLRFELTQIDELAGRYDATYDDEVIALKSEIDDNRFISKDQMWKIARWKSPRRAALIFKNPDGYVEETTRFALSTTSERARIESLTILDGVSWPTASVVLHLYHKDPYPMLDFRALWSVSEDVPSQYDFDFWCKYVEFCRSIAEQANTNMRTLDRALWQYSDEDTKKQTSERMMMP